MKTVQRARAEGPAASGLFSVAAHVATQLSAAARQYSTRSQDAVRAYAEGLDATDAAAASAAYSRAVAFDPNFGPPYLTWVGAEASRQNRAGIEHVLQLAKSRGDALPAYERARLALNAAELNGDNVAKMQALAALAKAGPPDAGVYKGLGDAALQGRRYRDAVNAYHQALAIAPDDIAVLNLLGYAEAYLGDLPRALQALKKYEQLQPAQANPLDSQGDVNLYSGHYAEAEKMYLEALAKNENLLAARHNLAIVLHRMWVNGTDFRFGKEEAATA